MSLSKEIGGYFGLETPTGKSLHPDALALNCARNCLRYIVRAYRIKEIYVPYYTCPAVWQSLQQEQCEMRFYHIDEKLLPTENFDRASYVVYTNYFGVCSKNLQILSEKYENLIVDNAQAFYSPHYGLASFNSPRKFFGVSDGGYLYCDQAVGETLELDISYQRFTHLLKRLDLGSSFGYGDFCANEDLFKNEPIKKMSRLTQTILESIDYMQYRKKRLINFDILHRGLSASNRFPIDLSNEDAPMVYPYLADRVGLREKLIQNKIYTATYWLGVNKDCREDIYSTHLVPLPMDHRYGADDMERILEIVGE